MIFKKNKEEQVREIPKRVQNMRREELLAWADTVLMQAGASFDAWRLHGAPLEDVVLASETFAAIVTELKNRTV